TEFSLRTGTPTQRRSPRPRSFSLVLLLRAGMQVSVTVNPYLLHDSGLNFGSYPISPRLPWAMDMRIRRRCRGRLLASLEPHFDALAEQSVNPRAHAGDELGVGLRRRIRRLGGGSMGCGW